MTRYRPGDHSGKCREETGDMIRAAALPGIKVDEDCKRNYPYDELASDARFTGADNQEYSDLRCLTTAC
ncbi:MAG: hypothetical protein ACLTDF_11230 [Coprococcus sp.]